MRSRTLFFWQVSHSYRWLRISAVFAVLLLVSCGGEPGGPVIKDKPNLRILRLDASSANVYIVEQGEVSLMIDAGNPGDEAEYERLMWELGFDPESLDYLLLMHGHTDHAGTAPLNINLLSFISDMVLV